MSEQAKDLMGWALEDYVAKVNPTPDLRAALERFVNNTRALFAATPIRGLSADATGMALQLVDGRVLLFADHSVTVPRDPGDFGGYSFIGSTPERNPGMQSPTDRPIFGK